MLHSHAHNLEQRDAVYSSLVPSQPTYSAFPATLQQHEAPNDHDESYEPNEDHRASSQQESAIRTAQLAPPLMRNAAPPGHFDMLPPPNSTHGSWQALHDYAQSHASEHGYALSINTTAKNRSRIKLACVCYGQPKNTHKLTAETRIRKNRVSYKTGCKMWIEGKKQDDGAWLLRVGEPAHNHPGRATEGWAVQRKRTWGVVGGRIGVGGVTAKEELARLSTSESKGNGEQAEDERDEDGLESASVSSPHRPNHSLERGGMVWKIVEEEMLRKGEPNQGRDRGVGRTVDVLQARLPGIHIFKRDVYNIRAQIKRAKKATGPQVSEALPDRDDDNQNNKNTEVSRHDDVILEPPEAPQVKIHSQPRYETRRRSESSTFETTAVSIQIDPSLTAEGSIVPRSLPIHPQSQAVEAELERLRRENAELRRLLNEKTNEIEKQSIEITGLRTQMDYVMNMGLSNARGGMG
ncbi:hypothetical protein BKA66DRAFT_512659 [Pyrenochaeta sp. MPI-SDFR-AT-0127]|nr:hypothetical protein BKA66DRAFT_512659 [Pyrenochaeta sp. MPI-SDFR-AT-0127]